MNKHYLMRATVFPSVNTWSCTCYSMHPTFRNVQSKDIADIPDWLSVILTVAVVNEYTIRVPDCDGDIITWFRTTIDYKLVEFVDHRDHNA